MRLLCGHDGDSPNCDLGEKWVKGMCRTCWLYHHDALYAEKWGNDDHPTAREKLPKPAPRRPRSIAATPLTGDMVRKAGGCCGGNKPKP